MYLINLLFLFLCVYIKCSYTFFFVNKTFFNYNIPNKQYNATKVCHFLNGVLVDFRNCHRPVNCNIPNNKRQPKVSFSMLDGLVDGHELNFIILK